MYLVEKGKKLQKIVSAINERMQNDAKIFLQRAANGRTNERCCCQSSQSEQWRISVQWKRNNTGKG